MKRNLIAHYQQGTSDKVYMSCVRRDKDGTYTVVAKWGRRGKNLQSQVKFSGLSESAAEMEQRAIFESKLKKGYKDIASQAYHGPVTRIDRSLQMHLEPEDDEPEVPFIPTDEELARKPEPPMPEDEGEEDVVRVACCVDNVGIEEQFDAGIEYVCEMHAEPTMLWVYDKMGEKRECFSERFEMLAVGCEQ